MQPKNYDDYDVWRAGLAAALDESGMSVAEVVNKSGLSKSKFYAIRNAERRSVPSAEDLEALSRALGYTTEFLIEKGKEAWDAGDKGARESEMFPYLFVAKTEFVAVDAEGNIVKRQPSDAAGLVERNGLGAEPISEDAVAVYRIKDTSMQPFINKNAVVVLNMKDKYLQSGQLYLLRFRDELMVRYLDRLESGGIRIRANDPAYPCFEVQADRIGELQICGRVLYQKGPTS